MFRDVFGGIPGVTVSTRFLVIIGLTGGLLQEGPQLTEYLFCFFFPNKTEIKKFRRIFESPK